MASIRDVAFFAYSVRDVPAAERFYRDVLGLTPAQRFGDHWIEFDAGSTTFGIGNGEPLGYEPGKSSGISFEVDDVAGMRARLLEHGVEAGELVELPNCTQCFASDPEGNRFALHQKKS